MLHRSFDHEGQLVERVARQGHQVGAVHVESILLQDALGLVSRLCIVAIDQENIGCVPTARHQLVLGILSHIPHVLLLQVALLGFTQLHIELLLSCFLFAESVKFVLQIVVLVFELDAKKAANGAQRQIRVKVAAAHAPDSTDLFKMALTYEF